MYRYISVQVTVQEQAITAIGNLSLTQSLGPRLRASGCVEAVVESPLLSQPTDCFPKG